MAKIHNPTVIAFAIASFLGTAGACSIKMQAGANSADDAASASASSSAPAAASTPAATASATTTTAASTAPTTTAAPSASAPAASAAPTTTAPAAPPATPIVRKSAKINLPAAFVFDAGSAKLSSDPNNEQLMTQLVKFLKKKKEITQMRVEGHTDAGGDAAANLKLSGERALAIKNALVAKGIKAERVVAVGFGGTKPIADGSTPEGKAQNERLQFRVATLKGRRYLGLDPLGGGTEFK